MSWKVVPKFPRCPYIIQASDLVVQRQNSKNMDSVCVEVLVGLALLNHSGTQFLFVVKYRYLSFGSKKNLANPVSKTTSTISTWFKRDGEKNASIPCWVIHVFKLIKLMNIFGFSKYVNTRTWQYIINHDDSNIHDLMYIYYSNECYYYIYHCSSKPLQEILFHRFVVITQQ